MASRYRIRRQRKGRKLRKQKESWLRRWGARVGKGVLSVATVGSLTFLGFNAYRYVQHSGQLNIGEVRIMGCMNIVESELLDLAKVDFRSNLFNLDLQEVSHRLAQHPWVEKAKVHRDVSGKALVIEVQERVPRALILLDELCLMDRNGEVFKKAEPKEKLDFPIFTGLTRQEWRKREPQTMEVLQQALELLDQMEGRKIFTIQEISEVHLNKKNGLTIYTLSGGVPIRLGTGDYADKLNRLEKVLPDLRNKWRSVEYLALDYPKKVVVKMKESAPEKTRKS
jgi:cell division septal protein FtsQ